MKNTINPKTQEKGIQKNKNKDRIDRNRYITQQDILKRHHKFIRESDSQQSENSDKSKERQAERSARKKNKNRNIYEQYGQNLAKKYYSKLFKQYALIDLSRFETGQIGCRWRTQKQVIQQKGQKICGSVDCRKGSKQIYEMNFGYIQQGVKKNTLVKVSVCQQCGKKMNYKKLHKRIQNLTAIKEKIQQKQK